MTDRHLDDAAFHLANAARSLERARDEARTPAQHAVIWRMQQRAERGRDQARAVRLRLRELRA